jgi:hypothetical protein
MPETTNEEGNRHTKARSVCENQQSATLWPPKTSKPKSKPRSGLRRRINREVVEFEHMAEHRRNDALNRGRRRHAIQSLTQATRRQLSERLGRRAK